MGAYLSCFNISWKHCRCIVCPHRSTDVSRNESNRYCLARTVQFSHGQQRFISVPVGLRAWNNGRRTHLVADGAVVLHRVLDAAVLLPQGRRVAGSWWQKRKNQETGGDWIQRMGDAEELLTALLAVEEVFPPSNSAEIFSQLCNFEIVNIISKIPSKPRFLSLSNEIGSN